METKTLTLKLAVPMTLAKELEIHREISTVIKEINAIEAQKKRLPPLKARMNELNLSIEAQTVEAEVDCEEFPDLETGLFKTRRLDTGEIIKTRVMDPEERQVSIPGMNGEVTKRLEELNKTEEQVVAGSPEEAEQMRETRLAEEKATRAFDALEPGGLVEILVGDEWRGFSVGAKSEFHFTVEGKNYDVSKYGISWRPTATWDDVVSESQERERLAQIAALAEDQAKDEATTKKQLLVAPPRKKRVTVKDHDGNVLARGGDVDTPAADGLPEAPAPAPAPAESTPPAELCAPDCEQQHKHTEQRTAF